MYWPVMIAFIIAGTAFVADIAASAAVAAMNSGPVPGIPIAFGMVVDVVYGIFALQGAGAVLRMPSRWYTLPLMVAYVVFLVGGMFVAFGIWKPVVDWLAPNFVWLVQFA